MEKEQEKLMNEFNVPIVGKKRIALFNGFVGKSDLIRISGQIVDIPILENYLEEDWDIFCMLPASMINRFRAIQDINMGPVRSPRLQLDIIPYEKKTIQELNEVKPIATLKSISGTNSGVFHIPLKTIISRLESGKYLIRSQLKGTDSIRQNFLDLAFLTTRGNQYIQSDQTIGYGRLRILPENYESFIIISDIDKTFLNTKFEDRQGLLETLLERIENKKPIPCMEEFYRIIKTHDYPLIFISASPTFFQRVLEGVFKRFEIPIEGLYLKKITNPVSNITSKVFQVLLHFNEYLNQGINEMVNRSVKFLNTTLQTMVDQTAYKLKVLLKLRTMQPPFAREVLIGDNTESDFLIFTLYQMIISGILPESQISDFLYQLRFKGKEVINRDMANEIQNLAKENIQTHGAINSVHSSFIHRAYQHPDQDGIYELLEETLKMKIEQLENQNIKLPLVYERMWELALLSYKKNIIHKKDLQALIQYYLKVFPEEKDKIQKELKNASLHIE